MFEEFKKFILKGNVVDLAVAVVVGAAFGAVVTAFVADFVTPLIAAIGGQPDFSALSLTINGSKFAYGHFLNAVISFLMIATIVFFFVVQPLNKLQERAERRMKAKEESDSKECPHCLSEVPKAAKKCKYCTSSI